MKLPVAVLLALLLLCGPAPAADAPEAVAERCVRLAWDGDAAAAYALFDEGMRGAVTPEKLRDLVAREKAERGAIRSLTRTVQVKGGYTQVQLLARFERGRPIRFTLAVDATGRVAGLFFAPAAVDATEGDLAAAAKAVPGQVAVMALVAERPEASFSLRADEAFSVGSQFKVLILAGAAERMAGGSLRPEDRIPISPRSRSFPSGVLQGFDPGLRPTVNDLLSHMIAISDNTATDTMLWALGRDRLEARFDDWGFRSRPELFSTAEMFGLAAGLGGLPEAPSGRREALAALDRKGRYAAASKALDAVASDREAAERGIDRYYTDVSFAQRRELAQLLDWHIPARELADFYRRVSTGTFESSEVSGTVSRYLHKGGPGIIGAYLKADPRVKGIARKGGSDAGIVTDGGFVTTADGRHVVIVVMANGLPAESSEDEAISKLGDLAQQIFDYLESKTRK